MNEMGMTHDKAYKKSAELSGRFWVNITHMEIRQFYNTMVRMAQAFNYGYKLVDGHGNFQSINGDSAAAMRYCGKTRMKKIKHSGRYR